MSQWDPDDDDLVDELPAPPRKSIPEADRELLHLAARAIGPVRVEDVDGEQWLILHFADGTEVHGWNPLLFYADTFEMQVQLHLSVEVSRRAAIAWVRPQPGAKLIDCTEEINGDDAAATARAIVRAAAEIGKQRA